MHMHSHTVHIHRFFLSFLLSFFHGWPTPNFIDSQEFVLRRLAHMNTSRITKKYA